jgi:rRNA maturation RNase YbeY
MITISITKQSNYPVDSRRLQKVLANFFAKKGIVSDAEASVAIVGEKKMLAISKRYLKGDKSLHTVLSFTPEDSKEKFIYPPENIVHLGDVVICFPAALKEAKVEEKLIEEKINELAEHGAMHLLGIHHE